MNGKVLALSGGVGGAKLALGLARILGPEELIVIVNTGDDFRHLGLDISPDLDTLLYTLAGLSDPIQGWGRRDETWNFMAAMAQLGGATWFRLGDADLAMHMERTRRLAQGETLSTIIDDLRRRLDISARIGPMSDDAVRTRLCTDAGWQDFQEYFVRDRCVPAVRELAYVGAETARASPLLLSALSDAGLRSIVICPSNPFLSIEPILATGDVRHALANRLAPAVAVSPIIGGKAVKGPTAKIMEELGLEINNTTIANRYAGLIDALLVDTADAGISVPPDIEVIAAPTLMTTLEDREQLARAALAAADRIAASPRPTRRQFDA